MNYDYHHKFRAPEDVKEVTRGLDEPKIDPRMYSAGRKDLNDHPKDSTVAPKPGDLRNGDLVSLLLAATPPYLYNMPLVPQTFFFSEMLRSFVQAKTDRQTLKSQQVQHRRPRKRTWRELTPPKSLPADPGDKPLELTTTKHPTEEKKAAKPVVEKKVPFSSDFTVDKLANSSISSAEPAGNVSTDLLPPNPPVWYPPMYPTHPPYPIDPLHFFIDLRVSAHIWDRKMAAEKLNTDSGPGPGSPLNLQTSASEAKAPGEKMMPVLEPSLSKNRHNSAFSVPVPHREQPAASPPPARQHHTTNSNSVHYIMSNLDTIYKRNKELDTDKPVQTAEGEEDDGKEDKDQENKEEKKKKKCKDLRALIGLELVVDYVKQDSDASDEEEDDDEAEKPNKSEEESEEKGEELDEEDGITNVY